MRRRLSLDTDYEEVPEDGLVADRSRKSRLRERLAEKMNLQICFVDDDDQMIESQTNGCSDENGHDSVPKANVSKPIVSNSKTVSNTNNTNEKSTSSHRHLLPFNLSSLFTLPMTMMSQSGSNTSTSCQLSFNSFPEYLDHLHKEAKKSLKAAKEMSRMQSQLEREQSLNQKQSKSNQESKEESKEEEEEEEDTNDPVIRINDLKKKSLKRIRMMEKDLVIKTNQLNSLLVKLLEEREELLMEQDSLLIDIEDLTQLL